MGRHIIKKGKKQQSFISFSLGSLVCLISLLVHLYFRLVHQYEHILEGFNASAALG